MEQHDFVVARVTRYDTGPSVVEGISPDTPLWVTGRYVEDEISYDIEDEVALIWPATTQWRGGIQLSRVYDDWSIIPESEWPDEVCAAVAKHVLLGGAQDEETE